MSCAEFCALFCEHVDGVRRCRRSSICKRAALFVLTKIDEILTWEQQKKVERNTRFVELGSYLCEARAGLYWRLANLKSFDEFPARRGRDGNFRKSRTG
jgi:hypothetical protein